jgi:hypothetical protein
VVVVGVGVGVVVTVGVVGVGVGALTETVGARLVVDHVVWVVGVPWLTTVLVVVTTVSPEVGCDTWVTVPCVPSGVVEP